MYDPKTKKILYRMAAPTPRKETAEDRDNPPDYELNGDCREAYNLGNGCRWIRGRRLGS